MLTEVEKTEARRFLGYPVFGADRAGNMGWRFYQASGSLEYRLNNLSTSEEGVLRGYLGTLGGLERAIPETGAGLDTGSAMGWVRNTAELADRERLFDGWCRRFCAFLGVPPGPSLSSKASVSLVV